MKAPSNPHRLVAYKNEEFLDSPAARSLRILSEYLEPLEHFRREKVRDTIVFFGSARITEDGPLGNYYRDARTLAQRFTQWSDSLPDPTCRFVVCSGGGAGIMEVINCDELVKYGTIAPDDVSLFEFADDPDPALKLLQEGLMKYHFQPQPETPAIAKSRDPDPASTQK